MSRISDENKRIKESIIDLQARSMRDNLVFSGIPEQEDEDPELTIKIFIQNQLKLPGEKHPFSPSPPPGREET